MNTINLNFFIDNPENWNKNQLKIFKSRVRYIVKKIFSLENKLCHILNLNLTDDLKIKNLNKKYLNHNYETDVLTFRYDDEVIEADVIVSVDTVKKNSYKYKVDFIDELFRVVIHGVLHLCGYNDNTKNQKIIMRRKENFYLKLLKDKINVSR